MPTLDAATLRQFTSDIFRRAGTPDNEARIVADHLVDANLTGHDSHGVIRVPGYVQQIQKGTLVPGAELRLIQDRPALGLLDGAWNFGQVAMRRATEIAIDKVKREGIAYVGVVRCNHIGRLGEYTALAANRGVASFVTVSLPTSSIVAPYGGARGALGTNPISFGFPAGAGEPDFVFDAATSVSAEGKVRVARDKGVNLPPGRIIDRTGGPSVKPQDLYDGGALLTAGEHKGYALSLASLMFSAVLTHAWEHAQGGDPSAAAIIALDAEAFGPREALARHVAWLYARMRGTPPAEGFEAVLIPGEPELRSRAERLANGVPLPERTWAALVETAESVGVGVPATVSR